DQTAVAVARRAGRGYESLRAGRLDAPDQTDPRSFWANDPARRTQHESGDGRLRAHPGGRLREIDRARPAAGNQERSESDRSVSRRLVTQSTKCSRWKTFPLTTAPSRRSPASRYESS